MTNRVSVVIPTYNEEKVIESCLKSIKAQNTSIEIIVVDNLSTDQTVKIALQFTPLILKKGNERSNQRNFGAKIAKGNFLLFLDADMKLTNGSIEEALLKAQKGKYIIAFPEKSAGENFWEKSIALERNLYKREKLIAAARFYPKDLFVKLGGFDKNLVAGEDWDLTIRAQKLGYILISTTKSIIHVERIKSLQQFLTKKRYYSKNIYLYAQKHPNFFAHQSSFRKRLSIYLKNWPKLTSDPLHFFGFLFLKTLIWYDWRRHGK